MKITDYLFNNYKDDTGEAISTPFPLLSGGKKIASRFPSGVGESVKRAVHAAPNRVSSAAKVSWAVGLVNAIVSKKLAVAYFDAHSAVYMEYAAGNGEVYAAVYNGSTFTVKWLNKEPAPETKEAEMVEIRLLPMFLWYYRHGKDNEYNEALIKCVNDCSLMGNMATENAALMCDSLYYGLKAENLVDKDIATDELLIEELIQMVNSSEIKTDKFVHTSKFKFIVQSSSAATPVEDDTDALYKDICEGKLVIPYSWTDEQKAKIMPLSFLETYIPNKHFFKLIKRMRAKLTKLINAINSGEDAYPIMLKERCVINAMYNGKPGCGKTTLVQAVSAAFGLCDNPQSSFRGR